MQVDDDDDDHEANMGAVVLGHGGVVRTMERGQLRQWTAHCSPGLGSDFASVVAEKKPAAASRAALDEHSRLWDDKTHRLQSRAS
jgi:hypothetical protein